MRNRKSRRLFVLGGCAAVAVVSLAGRARAAVTVYSDIADTSFTGISFPYAPYNPTATVGGTTYASLVADDITPIVGYAGETVTSAVFSVYNGAVDPTTSLPVPVTVDADVRFYAADGSGGGPGTLLFAADVGPISLAANQSLLEPVAFPTTGPQFALPSGTFYAGVSFSDGGTTGVTATELADVGQLAYDPPTVGSSADSFFQSGGADAFVTNNPAGDPTVNFGGTPAGNFGWQINVSGSPVPEPASAGVIGVAAAAGLLRRRRAATGR